MNHLNFGFILLIFKFFRHLFAFSPWQDARPDIAYGSKVQKYARNLLESHKLDFVQFCDGISERIAGPFFLFLLINSAFGYEFRKKRKKLQSTSSGSARQKLYKVEINN